MAEITVRAAIVADAPAIASVNVRAWRWAYRDLLPDSLLDGLSVEDGAARWRQHLTNRPGAVDVWVAERSGGVVGFARAGSSLAVHAAPGTGEVYAIYVDPSVVGTGVGQALLAHAVAALREQGYRAATLWVLEGNHRARRFYEAAGWLPDGATQVRHREGVALHEVRYRIELRD